MKKQKAMLSFRLPYKLTKKRKWYLASCPILDVHSQGQTEQQAKNNLVEATTAFFLSCFERNTLDEVLRDCGFEPQTAHEAPVGRRQHKADDFMDVPVPLVYTSSPPKACQA